MLRSDAKEEALKITKNERMEVARGPRKWKGHSSGGGLGFEEEGQEAKGWIFTEKSLVRWRQGEVHIYGLFFSEKSR